MPNRQRLGIHTMTLKSWSLQETCAALEAAEVPAITLWRQAIEPVGVDMARQLVEDAGLRVTSLCRGGFFPAATEQGRRDAIDENRRVIDEAAAVGAPAVVLVCGAVPGQSLQTSRAQIQDGIAAVLPHANACGINLSIEPLHPIYAADRSAVNTMAQARRMCEQLNGTNETRVGIAADVYHIWFDDSLEQEILLSGKAGWLHAFHICDWKVEQSDPLQDRGLMGEGVIDIRQIHNWMTAAGYTGDIEVEIFSTHHWAKDPSLFLREILTAYDDCL
ncbi:MAG: sugar phosphate isomerase/epimerase [Kiritimatiellae bacterium]|jgi:sugar phosphate isomerase/epimerase|nr:sugar phosphate isomerase/epimerase [Kiritimatiellia bacterium]